MRIKKTLTSSKVIGLKPDKSNKKSRSKKK